MLEVINLIVSLNKEMERSIIIRSNIIVPFKRKDIEILMVLLYMAEVLLLFNQTNYCFKLMLI